MEEDLLDVSTLRVNDKIQNANGEVGTVIAVNPTAAVNCVAVAWEMSGIWLYRRDEKFPGVTVFERASLFDTTAVLPSDILNSLYTLPDPTNWAIQALIGWSAHRNELQRIAQLGLTEPGDLRIAWHACKYIFEVVDKMRGKIVDWTQN